LAEDSDTVAGIDLAEDSDTVADQDAEPEDPPSDERPEE
jgi:hypothetical protein